jgi:hypothetical protein
MLLSEILVQAVRKAKGFSSTTRAALDEKFKKLAERKYKTNLF